MTTENMIYGVRGPDLRNTVVRADSPEGAREMLMDGDVIVVSADGGRTWSSAAEALIDTTVAQAPTCRVVDLIVQWTNEDRDLQVREGDLVVDDGDLKLVAEVEWFPAHSARVRVGYEGEDALRSYDPDTWVAVRRYVDSED
jgi:hypothetical protein